MKPLIGKPCIRAFLISYKNENKYKNLRKSYGKFTELFRIKCGTFNNFSECSEFYSENFCKFSKTLFRKYLYPQLMHISIKFLELFFPCMV